MPAGRTGRRPAGRYATTGSPLPSQTARGETQERAAAWWTPSQSGLEFVPSPYRELTPAVERYLDELDQRWSNDTITIVIPEFLTGRLLSPIQLLHNQSAAALKLALLYRKGTVVTSVPYHIENHKSVDGHV